MKKITLAFLFILFGLLSVLAQSNSALDDKPSYQELKKAGLLKDYTMEQMTEMQANESSDMQSRIDSIESMRSIEPTTPSIQTTSNAFAITPVNPNICSGQSVTLSASNSFTYSSTGLYIADDRWSSVINLPFSFTFYGSSYNNCIISTNGSIGFNTAYANWWSSWWNWIYTQPNVWPADIRNTINGPWIDLYIPISGTCKYSTVGTAPNRIFVVEYCNVSYWWCWYTYYFSGQMLLYEGTNIIETHIYDRPAGCWWIGSSHAIHSTQNSTGTTAAVVAGRNAPDVWSTANEGKRWTWNPSTLNYDISNISFAPVGFFNAGTIQWYDASNTLIGTGSTYAVPSNLSAGTYVYHATVTTSWCGGTISYTAYDTVTVTNSLSAPTANSVTICPNTSTTLSGSCGGNCLWYNVSTGGVPLATGFYTTPSLSTTTTYYVAYSSGSCTSPRTPVTVTIGATLAAPTAVTSSVCNSNIATSLSANCGGNCQWYTQSTGGTPVGGGSPFTTIPPTTTYWVQTMDGNGCLSPRTQVTVNVGSLAVTANSSVNCPSSLQNLSATETGMALVNANVQSTTIPSAGAPNLGIDCNEPDDPGCVGNYVTSTIITPANVSNPMTTSSVQSVYLSLYDWILDGAVGADAQLWLQSPAGTFLLLTDNRPFNSDFDSNYCYCPTFTYAGTGGLLPQMDGPYNGVDYLPEGGILDFTGENPYVNGGVWTLYLVDPDNWAQGSFGDLAIVDFDIVFGTYPPSTYIWASSGTCGNLSSTSISNPTYTPPSISGNYTCNYTVTVTNGSCVGTASINLGCNLLPVELLSYSGKNIQNANVLNWTTATETNNSYFTLEHLSDGETVIAQWKVPSLAQNGNSSTAIDYSLTHKDVKPGVYYYRLSQTDINGATEVKGTIAITVKAGREIMTVVPNPTASIAEVTYNCNANETSTLKMFDHAGNLLLTKLITCSKGENKFILDLSIHPDGIYLITIAASDNLYKARLVKSE
jgi:hypothetical protein